MSFSFNAIGTKEDVTAQLEAASVPGGSDRFNEFGADLRDLLVRHFGAETAAAGEGHEYRYVVKASGHGGGNSPLYVQLTIEACWVPVVSADSISGDAPAEDTASA
jgi:hypothetical protein